MAAGAAMLPTLIVAGTAARRTMMAAGSAAPSMTSVGSDARRRAWVFPGLFQGDGDGQLRLD